MRMSNSGSNSSNSSSSRNPYSFPDFSLRRLLLQGARAARGSPPLGTRLCDVERGNTKHEKMHAVNSGSSGGSSSSTRNNVDSVSQHSATPPSSNSNGKRLSSMSPPHKSTDSTTTAASPGATATPGGGTGLDCPLCYNHGPHDDFYFLLTCKHFSCRNCLESYLMIEILESRTDIACPQCAESMHPSDIQELLKNHPDFISKYEDFMVRRVLLADPDSRWCPAPDCSYAVIASGCASCPRIKCERPGCDINFCYHCKAEWHPDQTCDTARASRQSPIHAPSGSISQDSHHRDDIKPCPRCQVLIVKMDDGSCNHMVCAVCGSEFCWLCMKEISDLHYLSPSGCTFWGKKPWSRKKKLFWQLGTLVGAPVGIALVAGIAVPAMIIGIPVWVGRKIQTRYRLASKHKRNSAVLAGVAASILVSPVLAGLAVAIGVPILLFYVYGVVPVSLCRAGCGVSTTRDGFKFDFDEEDIGSRNQDASSVDAVSRIGATSIGEVSLSVASGSHLGVSGHNPSFGAGGGSAGGGGGLGGIGSMAHALNRESTTALAGSITGHKLEVQADVSSSETASAVTCVSEKSGNTLNDTASTRALAGSILSYKPNIESSNISEDGVSERVRFDNTICYVIDGRKDCSDIWYTAPLDQDISADKASVGSARSFRSSDKSDIDTTSMSSVHKRMVFGGQRFTTKTQHRNVSVESTNYIPESVNQELDIPSSIINTINHNSNTSSTSSTTTTSTQSTQMHLSTSTNIEFGNQIIGTLTSDTTGISNCLLNGQDATIQTEPTLTLPKANDKYATSTSSSSLFNSGQPSASSSSAAATTTTTTNTKNLNTKSMSKAAILRNLFFSQSQNGSGGSSKS